MQSVSRRLEAARAVLALNIDTASLMRAGRWKNTRMPMRYGEKVLVSRGVMARAGPIDARQFDRWEGVSSFEDREGTNGKRHIFLKVLT
jgi:hypothetical protein